MIQLKQGKKGKKKIKHRHKQNKQQALTGDLTPNLKMTSEVTMNHEVNIPAKSLMSG